MNIIRTYFTKDTTIIRNSYVNTGKNPIAELFYGGSTNTNDTKYSRYLLNLDLTDLSNKTSCYNTTGMTHTLNMTNTSTFDSELYCKTSCSSGGEVRRATSFDLILFEIPESWDEGNGYDYSDSKSITSNEGNDTYCESPSNWFERGSGINWFNSGVYSGSPETYNGGIIIGSQHFDHGDENISIDVSDYINNLLLTGDTENFNGLGVAYKYSQEIMSDRDTFYVGFFGKDTNTVYEPYVETVINNTIKDDRDHFYMGKTNRLYLYINGGGEPTDASFGGVTIKDHNDNTYITIPQSEIIKQSCGVYYVELSVPNDPDSPYCEDLMFTDTWNDVTINGNLLGDSEQEFFLRRENKYYTIGTSMASGVSGLGVGNSNNLSIYDYSFRVSGIKHMEKIKRGDTRRLNVEARVPLTLDQVGVLDNIYYRIYTREGNTQIDYIDWAEINRSYDGNFFLVDTSWFIPNDYYLELKITSGDEVRTYDDVIKFEIVSEK